MIGVLSSARLLRIATAVSLLLRATPAQTPASPSPPQSCQAIQLSLGTDDENGNFNGMSHSGTLLVLRNLGPAACRLDPTPQLALLDANHQDLHISVTLDTPFNRGPVRDGRPLPLGHGPVVLPLILAVNAEATASLRWVSGDVYDHGTCITPATLQLNLAGQTTAIAFGRQLCGPDPAHLAISATRLALDPVYHSPR